MTKSGRLRVGDIVNCCGHATSYKERGAATCTRGKVVEILSDGVFVEGAWSDGHSSHGALYEQISRYRKPRRPSKREVELRKLHIKGCAHFIVQYTSREMDTLLRAMHRVTTGRGPWRVGRMWINGSHLDYLDYMEVQLTEKQAAYLARIRVSESIRRLTPLESAHD